MSPNVPTPEPPKPYRVCLSVSGVVQWRPTWAYSPAEAAFQAAVELAAEIGSDDVRVTQVTPDFEAFARAHVNHNG